MTGLYWAVVALAWVGSGVGVSTGDALQSLVMIGASLLLAGIAIWLRLGQPVAYRLEQDGLVIERRRGSTRIAGRVAPHHDKATLGLRLGSGGVYGYRGYFKLQGAGWARALATDVRRVVLINVGDRRVVLSPVDPAALVSEVRNA